MIFNAHAHNFNDMNNALNALDNIIDNQNHNPVDVNHVGNHVINHLVNNNLNNVGINHLFLGLLLNGIPDLAPGSGN